MSVPKQTAPRPVEERRIFTRSAFHIIAAKTVRKLVQRAYSPHVVSQARFEPAAFETHSL